MAQRDPEDLCCGDGILAEGLIEVPDTEEQDSIWVLSLDLHVLLHQGGLYDLLCHCLGGNGWGLFLFGVGDRVGFGGLAQDVLEEVGEELPTGELPITYQHALDLTTSG